jgi:hypothetical protein
MIAGTSTGQEFMDFRYQATVSIMTLRECLVTFRSAHCSSRGIGHTFTSSSLLFRTKTQPTR